MSGGIAYVYDPHGRFGERCNLAMVDVEPIKPAEAANAPADDAMRPRQRSVSVENNGMGDVLRHDAERLRILIERHLLYTGSARAREILDHWDQAVGHFVKVMPKDYRQALIAAAAEREAAKAVAAE